MQKKVVSPETIWGNMVSKFFDTTHNGIVRGKYSTKISISGIFWLIKNSIAGGKEITKVSISGIFLKKLKNSIAGGR